MSGPAAIMNILAVGPDKFLPSYTNSLKKTNLKKQQFMKDKFSLLKGIVYRYIQYCSFEKNIRRIMDTIYQTIGNRPAKINLFRNLFTYLYSTTDIWTPIGTFPTTIEKKLIQLNKEEPIFNIYQIRFGYICPYPKRNNEICCKQVKGTLCKRHSNCEKRRHSRISQSLSFLPTDLCNIVFLYSLPYSWLE